MDETGESSVPEVGPARQPRRTARTTPEGGHDMVVTVASEARLIAESVTAALVDAGVEAMAVPWQATEASGSEERNASNRLAVFISDLASHRIEEVCEHGQRAGCRWLVITEAPRGPAWGAMLDAGALAVVEATASIDGLIGVLVDVRADQSPIGHAERRSLLRQWWEVRLQQDRLRARMDTLSPREREVLGLLYEGTTVRLIAARLEVSESTVRSQVKSVLRKLAVPSQLAAVATFDELRAPIPRPRTSGY